MPNCKVSESEVVRIGKCQNRKVSELKSVRMAKNCKVSEFITFGTCQNWKVSETAQIGNCQKLLLLESFRTRSDWKDRKNMRFIQNRVKFYILKKERKERTAFSSDDLLLPLCM